MWRAAPQRERAKYIKAAAEERKKSQEGQQYVRRMQIEATAAALAAGAGVMEAARAGLEVGACCCCAAATATAGLALCGSLSPSTCRALNSRTLSCCPAYRPPAAHWWR